MQAPDNNLFERPNLQENVVISVSAKIITGMIEADPTLSYDPKPQAASLQGRIIERDAHSVRVEFDYGNRGKFQYVIAISRL